MSEDAIQSDGRHLALRVVTMPRDTNPYGTVFGGIILSYIDQAGFVEARRFGVHRWVTASMEHVDFKSPVRLGDVVSFFTRTLFFGRTSVRVEVEVEVERADTGERAIVTTAQLVMVSIDCDGKPMPFRDKDPTLC
jgi:acyl-CoA thioesterase YciA